MTSQRNRTSSPFTASERDLIRLELMPRFGQEPQLANGLFLRTWRAGPHKGELKIPKAIQGMLDRGLVEIQPTPMGRQAAFFTEAGLAGLRQLLQDRRAMDPERFAHLREALGMDRDASELSSSETQR
jgi:hypothetical protein